MPATKIQRHNPVFVVKRDILPIFVISEPDGKIVSYEGTGFLVAPRVLVTCWHCVRDSLPPRQHYAVMVVGEHQAFHLLNIEQDPTGLDLATATIEELSPTLNLNLGSDADTFQGLEVMSYGFPLGWVTAQPDGRSLLSVPGRMLRGYITRTFRPTLKGYGPTPAIELDMPAPKGLSGATTDVWRSEAPRRCLRCP